MALWNVDLTTEDGALGAAQIGAFACFTAAVLGLISVVLVLAMGASVFATAPRGGLPIPALAGAAAALAEVVLFTVTGLRLRVGKGAFWAYAAAVVLVIELLAKVAALSVIGIMIDVVLLIALSNGIRGARALRRIGMSADETAGIFS